MKHDPPSSLTPREEEVRQLIERGLTNEEIAARLGISVPGVKYHVSQILSKLGVPSRREVGERRGWAGFFGRWAVALGAATAIVALIALGIGIFLTGAWQDDDASSTDAEAATGPVYIESISPSSGTIGDEIMIRGHGFTSTGNDIGITATANDSQPGRTAYETGVPSADGETLQFVLEDTLGACPFSQIDGVCPSIGYLLPIGELNVAVYNTNGTSNGVLFNREISPIEAAQDAVNGSRAYSEMTHALDELVAADYEGDTYTTSYGIGFRQDDDEVYIEVSVFGVDRGELEGIVPDEIEGYEVRLQ